MLKSKTIELLRSFDQQEMKRFDDFIRSPFFNKRAELINLYSYLYQVAPNFTVESVDRVKVYCSIFPGKKYDEKQIGYLMSYLSKLIEQFMSIQIYEKDPILPDYHLMDAFLDRKLYKHYEQHSSKLAKVRVGLARDDDFYFGNYLYSNLADRHFLLLKQRRFDKNLQNTVDNLDYYYVLNKLRYSCSMIQRQKILNADYSLNFLEETINYVENSSFLEEPLISLYYQILNILRNEEDTVHFVALKNLLYQHSGSYDRIKIYEIYQYAINYCARKLRKGEEEYVEEALNLNIDGIEKGVFFEDGYLSPWIFNNSVKSALRLKRYAFVEEFIAVYGAKLSDEFRQNAMNYNYAELYYYQRKLDLSLEHLKKVKFSDLIFHLGSRVLLVKIYYETGAEDALLSLIASFSIFLKRNRNISNVLRKTFLNFCDIVFQFVRKQPKKLIDIKDKITNTELLTDRTWLLKQADILLISMELDNGENTKT